MLRSVARWILRVGGWTPVGGIPEDPKAVFIAAPHTSNWDGFWALTYKVAFDIDVRFFAKHSLFWFPLGNLLRGLGGIDLDVRAAEVLAILGPNGAGKTSLVRALAGQVPVVDAQGPVGECHQGGHGGASTLWAGRCRRDREADGRHPARRV